MKADWQIADRRSFGWSCQSADAASVQAHLERVCHDCGRSTASKACKLVILKAIEEDPNRVPVAPVLSTELLANWSMHRGRARVLAREAILARQLPRDI